MSDPKDIWDGLGATNFSQPKTQEAKPSMLERVGQTAYDGAVGLSQGLSGGGADELMGAMPGTSIAEQQQVRSDARGRSPVAYDLGNAAGSAVPMLFSAGTSALPAGASALERFAEQLGLAAVQGGATSALGTDGNLQERAGQGLKGMGVSAGLSAAASGAGAVLGKGAEVADRLGNAARAAAFSTPGKLKTYAGTGGVDNTSQDLAREAERLGLTNSVIPQSAASYEAKAGAAKELAGQQHGAALTAADAENIFGDSGAVTQGLQGIQSAARANRGSLGAPRERVSTDLLDRLGPPQPMSPTELWALKKEYEASGGFVSDEIKRLPEGQAPLINQDAAGFARRELGDTMEMATPETREAFDTARRDYSYLAAIENLAKSRADHDASHGLGAVQTTGLVVGGGLAGHMFGHGAMGAAAGYGLGQANRIYGRDAAANVLNGVEGAMGFGADMTSGAGGAMGQVAGRGLSQEQQRSERERASNASKGHEMQNAVSRALQSDPSVLGQYAQQFQEAQQDPDPMVMSALISELNDDPQFRATVLPQLQRLSNPQGDY